MHRSLCQSAALALLQFLVSIAKALQGELRRDPLVGGNFETNEGAVAASEHAQHLIAERRADDADIGIAGLDRHFKGGLGIDLEHHASFLDRLGGKVEAKRRGVGAGTKIYRSTQQTQL